MSPATRIALPALLALGFVACSGAKSEIEELGARVEAREPEAETPDATRTQDQSVARPVGHKSNEAGGADRFAEGGEAKESADKPAEPAWADPDPTPVAELADEEEDAFDDAGAVGGLIGDEVALSGEFLESVPAGRAYQNGVGTASGATSSSGGAPSADSAVTQSRTRNRRGIRIAKDAEKLKRESAVAAPPPPPTSKPAPKVPASGPLTFDNKVVTVPESHTEDYTDYGVNGFTLTERDGLSTFAVDVDTASYTITRRKLREGYLPPQAAVRVEEFVNYFPYEYAQPDDGDPFSVDVEAAPSPYNPQNHIVRVGVQGKKVTFDTRKSVNLTFLVDVSGSMQSRDKIGLLKDTLKMLTEELEDGDTVALVTYAGATKVVLDPTPISERATILAALNGLNAGGSTAMGAGVELAYGLAEQTRRPGAVNRVIIASDGDANVGIRSHDQLSGFIKRYAQKGITLTTLGFGNGNYKDTMMERLANDGDGNYFYIDSLQESRRLFVDQLSSTLEVIAKDVKIQVDFNPDAVLAYRLIGYENRDIADRDFRNDKVDAGEIGAGHQVTALYEVALKDDPKGGLGTVRIRNKAPGPESPAVEREYVMPQNRIAGSFSHATAQLRLQTAAAGFAEILRGSPHMHEITLRDVAAIAREAKRVEYPEDSELVELIERASRLKGEGAVTSR